MIANLHPVRRGVDIRWKDSEQKRDQSNCCDLARPPEKNAACSGYFRRAADVNQRVRPWQRWRDNGEIRLWRDEMVRTGNRKEKREHEA